MKVIFDYIYNFIPKKITSKKKFRKILCGELKGIKIFSSLIFTQLFSIYEIKLHQKIKSQIKGISNIVVLGNHNGYTTLKLNFLFPGTRIICLEANKILCHDFRKTISSINKCKDIILEERAIGYKNSSFKIDILSSDMFFKDNSLPPSLPPSLSLICEAMK